MFSIVRRICFQEVHQISLRMTSLRVLPMDNVLPNSSSEYPNCRCNSKNYTTILYTKTMHLPIQPMYLDQQVRSKYNKSKRSKNDEDSDDEANEKDFEEDVGKDFKIVKTSVNSMRADLLIKAALGLARNKVEMAFYESKLRLNGEKMLKKSLHINVGDELDLIKGFSTNNPDHLIISRAEILDAKPKEDSIQVTLKRYKTMLVENYNGVHAYKTSVPNNLD